MGGKLNNLTFPKTVLVDTVSFCNLKCSMCSHKDTKRKKGRMEWSLFTKIIDEIASESPATRVWLVFFGEALILKNTNPSIFDMIKYAKSAGLKNVVLNSNGCLLDRESSQKLIAAGLDAIYIGIDAFCEETYNQLRVGGNYNQTVQNVLDLIEVKNEMKARKFRIHVQFVELAINKGQKDDFTQYWLSQGVDVKIRKELSWSGLVANKKQGDFNERRPCYWIMDTMSITDIGDVVTCAADPEGRFIAGNINSQSLKDVWQGKLGDLRKLHNDHEWEKLPFPCSECRDWLISYDDKVISNEKRGLKQKLSEVLKRARRA